MPIEVWRHAPSTLRLWINSGLLALENVVLLPHLWTAMVETRDAMGTKVLDGIDRVLDGAVESLVS